MLTEKEVIYTRPEAEEFIINEEYMTVIRLLFEYYENKNRTANYKSYEETDRRLNEYVELYFETDVHYLPGKGIFNVSDKNKNSINNAIIMGERDKNDGKRSDVLVFVHDTKNNKIFAFDCYHGTVDKYTLYNYEDVDKRTVKKFVNEAEQFIRLQEYWDLENDGYIQYLKGHPSNLDEIMKICDEARLTC